jgi:transcriptional regulator with XRE-family HTH domain
MIRITDPDNTAAALGELRARTGLTRRRFAEPTPVHEQRYGQYELGRRTPGIANLVRIARAHGYDLALIPREDE